MEEILDEQTELASEGIGTILFIGMITAIFLGALGAFILTMANQLS